MTNYALIVGIDRYQNAAWQLDSAVQDALRFASWAIREGGVGAANVKLLLSPTTPLGPQVAIPKTTVTLPVMDSTSRNLRSLLYDDIRDGHWGQGGDRLYFYYAGHGCSHPGVRGEKRAEPVLIPSDVEKLPRDYPFLYTFSDILEVLRECEPREQFFFLDACRDFALDGIVGSGGAPGGGRYMRPLTLPGGAAASKQFIIYATSPGERAQETRGRGVFGSTLIECLMGDPRAARRIAGAGDYELRFTDLYRFVQGEVQSRVSNIQGATRYVQLPEHDMEPSAPDPLVRSFTEDQIGEVELLVRVGPDVALDGGKLTVFYERFVEKGPLGPPLKAAQSIQLKPAYYSVEAESPAYQKLRTSAFRHPAGQPLEVTLTPMGPVVGAGIPPAQPRYLSFASNDDLVMIGVTGPEGYRAVQQGTVYIYDPKPGIYHVRVIAPEGVIDEQVFEYPYQSGQIQIKTPEPQIAPGQMSLLSLAGIAPLPNGNLQPSETLGEMANLKPASILGFAAYAAYTMPPEWGTRLRSFGLDPIPTDRRGEAWLNVLVSVETDDGEAGRFHDLSSVALYAGSDYRLGRFRALPGFPAAAQFLTAIPESNVTVELRLPDLPPTRFPLTCFLGRVATLCVHIPADRTMDLQMYLMPFHWEQLDSRSLRVVEQAQRFYSGSEPVPESMVEQFLYMKSLDPLLGCVAGYTLIRQGDIGRYRGTPSPNLPAGAWNPQSAMQNMLAHFGLLPDAHVIAGLCEPERREEHYAAAMDRGIPLFTEGFRVLLDHYRTQPQMLKGSMWHARRTLATGSAFSAWVGYEPALEVENGRFGPVPVAWSVLEEHRARIGSELGAVGAVRIESPELNTYRTGFLVAPDLVLTVNHVLNPVLAEGADGITLRGGVKLSFVAADRVDTPDAKGVAAVLLAIDQDARLALLRLAAPVEGVRPLSIAPLSTQPKPDQRIYVIGYPFVHTDLDPELVKHVFGDRLGTKRLEPGYIIAAPDDVRAFDHDAFTLGGSAGSPVIDLETGLVFGLHWGGMNQSNFRRGRASGLWKAANRGILRDAGVVAG